MRSNRLVNRRQTMAGIGQCVSKIVAAFRGMHVSPAKHSYAWLPRKCDYRTDRHMDKQTPDKVIPICRYASHVTQKRPSGAPLHTCQHYIMSPSALDPPPNIFEQVYFFILVHWRVAGTKHAMLCLILQCTSPFVFINDVFINFNVSSIEITSFLLMKFNFSLFSQCDKRHTCRCYGATCPMLGVSFWLQMYTDSKKTRQGPMSHYNTL